MSGPNFPFIVGELNTAELRGSFDTPVTITSLTGGSRIFVLDILIKIISQIYPQKKQLLLENDRNSDSLLEIIIDIVFNSFNYPSSEDDFTIQWRENHSSNASIISLIEWLLANREVLSERAYVCEFLQLPLEIPAEFMIDPVLVEAKDNLITVQQQFKDDFAALKDALMAGVSDDSGKKIRQHPHGSDTMDEAILTNADTSSSHNHGTQQISAKKRYVEWQNQVAGLASVVKRCKHERTQLMNRVERLKIKIENEPCITESRENEKVFRAIQSKMSEMRRLQESQSSMTEKWYKLTSDITQREMIQTNLQREHRVLSEILPHEMNAEEVLTQLSDYLDKQRMELMSIQRDTNETQQLLAEFIQVSEMEPVSASELAELNDELESETNRTMKLSDKRDQLMEQLDEKVATVKLRLIALTETRSKLETEVQHKKETLKKQREQLLKVESEMAALRLPKSGRRPMNEAEVKTYLKEMAAKKNAYVQGKDKMNALTKKISQLKEQLSALERDAEMEGHLDEYYAMKQERAMQDSKQSELQDLSSAKADVDQTKQDTLVEISNIVDSLNTQIRMNKTKLAPLVRQFKAKKQELMQLRNELAGLTLERDKFAEDMKEECDKIEQISLKNDAKTKGLFRQAERTEENLREREELVRSNRGKAGIQVYRKRLEERLRRVRRMKEKMVNELDHTKSTVKDTEKQSKLFSELIQTLQSKLAIVQHRVDLIKQTNAVNVTGEDRMVL